MIKEIKKEKRGKWLFKKLLLILACEYVMQCLLKKLREAKLFDICIMYKINSSKCGCNNTSLSISTNYSD